MRYFHCVIRKFCLCRLKKDVRTNRKLLAAEMYCSVVSADRSICRACVCAYASHIV